MNEHGACELIDFYYMQTDYTERCRGVVPGSAGDVLDDDPVGELKVFIYDLPGKYNKKLLKKDPRCLNHMFATEIFMHRFLLSSVVRTSIPEEADRFYTPVYPPCYLTPSGLPLPFKSLRMMRSASELIATKWPYWNRLEGQIISLSHHMTLALASIIRLNQCGVE
ncbi:probable glucuronosyltransferase Os01g0926700 isoform X2 [Lolium rigidum]|uniref:probable glucuronosyltransferase Os01g0926700 isoform X2 n=1 Tax=Lolium rigidum TaxID=89674 RepID=UPI001F5C3146|nr:probable glucuronosyltransferase Os01g0926700 isoform X2 [Lolium rigidum]